MEPMNQFWIVLGRTASGRFTGQSNVGHTTPAAAEAEALRLAAKDPGTTFFVLATVYAALAQKPTAQPVPIRGFIPEPEDIIDYMAAKAAVAATSADGWITWTGGENPVPGAMVECFFASKLVPGAPVDSAALRWDWQQGGIGGDITAYRVVRS
jgi:hypothetical protein